MKGQIRFDEFMNMSEDKQEEEPLTIIPTMANLCSGCLCNSCINNAESVTVRPDETPYDWKPCFLCDDCRKFDGDSKKRSMVTRVCDRYIIDNYHAKKNRKKFRVM